MLKELPVGGGDWDWVGVESSRDPKTRQHDARTTTDGAAGGHGDAAAAGHDDAAAAGCDGPAAAAARHDDAVAAGRDDAAGHDDAAAAGHDDAAAAGYDGAAAAGHDDASELKHGDAVAAKYDAGHGARTLYAAVHVARNQAGNANLGCCLFNFSFSLIAFSL